MKIVCDSIWISAIVLTWSKISSLGFWKVNRYGGCNVEGGMSIEKKPNRPAAYINM